MTFDPTSTLLATGSADSTVKVWDIEKQYCTHNLKGHQGIISTVGFHPDISRLLLYTAGEDYRLRVWNLLNSKCIAEVSAHYSMITSVCFSEDGSKVFTSGRDAVVSVIDAEVHKVIKVIPVFEVVESIVLLPNTCNYPALNVDNESIHVITAGNKGVLRVWNSDTGKCVYTTDPVYSRFDNNKQLEVKQAETTDDSMNIVQLIHNKEKNNLTVVTYDQNISILGLEKLVLQKQFAGNNDEILDVKYFNDNKYAIVATNSMHIKVFELSTWDCEILYGHTDIVLCIDVIPKSDMFISGSKDNTVRLWKMDPVAKQVSCLALGQGHTNAVGALAMSRVKPTFFVSGSEDCTLKLWTIPPKMDSSIITEIHSSVTEKAHDKTICSVAVAPNDKFIASGSSDKTAKLWRADNLKLIGVMRGHKRGIWCVQFSPVDQILATSSGDGTVKLWSLADFSCVRTFEGHDCAVLKVAFITRGMQIVSSATNGLIKLWTIKSNECVKTFEGHEDKVWALAVGDDDEMISGGADSNLITWKDVTEIEQVEAKEKQEEFILQEQTLSNLIQQKKYLKAIGLAITLEQPFRLLSILKEILSEDDGDNKLFKTLEKLRMDQIDSLLRFTVQWNTNSRHCHESQVVLSSVLKIYPPNQLKKLANLKSSVEGLIPYTERHFNRMSRLVQQSMFLEYTWQCMKGISSEQPDMELEESNVTEMEIKMEADVKSEESSSEESESDGEENDKIVQQNDSKTSGKSQKTASNNKTTMKDSDSDSEESDNENMKSVNVKQTKDNKSVEIVEDSDDSDPDDDSSDEEISLKKTSGGSVTSRNRKEDSRTGSGGRVVVKVQTESEESSDNDDMMETMNQEDKSVSMKPPTPKRNLYKDHLSEKSQNQKDVRSRSPKKRKITDKFTVVKGKSTKVTGLDLFVDERPSTEDYVVDSEATYSEKLIEGGKKRPTGRNIQKMGRKMNRKAKLRKPKTFGR
ncbi:Transducin (beta)-like 3 [Mactra antiquata]